MHSHQAKAHESVLTAVLKMYQRLNMQMRGSLTLRLTTVFNGRAVIIKIVVKTIKML